MAFWHFAASAAVKSAIALLLGWGVTVALRRRSPAARHLVWTLTVSAIVVLPGVSALLPSYTIESRIAGQDGPSAEGIARGPTGLRDVGEATIGNAPPASARAESPQIVTPKIRKPVWWLMVWGGGSCAVMLWAIAARVSCRRFARDATRVDAGPMFEAVEGLKRRFHMWRAVWVYIGPSVPMPLTYGAFRPRVLLPAEAADWPIAQLRSALLHELAHVKRWDFAAQSLGQLVCAMYWFNPLAWLAASRLRVDREAACDDWVVAQGTPADGYAEHLLAVARAIRERSMTEIGAMAMARISGLRRRVTRILDAGVDRRTVSSRHALIAVAGGVFAVVSLACAQVGGSREKLATQAAATMPANAPANQVAASQPTARPYPDRTIRISVLDNATGQPLVGANVDYSNTPSSGRVQTDARGEAKLILTGGWVPTISVWMSQYINQRMRWKLDNEGGPQPDDYVFRLDPVKPIGGKVVDGSGQPVAGANVEIFINGKMQDVGRFSIEWPWINRATVTEKDGAWHFDRVPPDAPSVKVAVWDYQHLSGDYFFLKPFEPLKALRDGTAISTLPTSVAVKGVVLNPFTGNPIPKATVSFGPDQSASNKIPPLTTDDEGRFSIGVKPGAKLFMTVSARGYRPEVHEETFEDKPTTLEFNLSTTSFVK